MDKQYYYLKGIEKIGPVTKEDILSMPKETFIWTDGYDAWVQLSKLDFYQPKFPELPIKKEPIDIIPTVKNVSMYGLWLLFHTIAFAFSKYGVFGRDFREYESLKEFWPFSSFYTYTSYYRGVGERDIYENFNGVFYNYDYTEFFTFLVIPIVFFLIYRIFIPNADLRINKHEGKLVKYFISFLLILWFLSFFESFNFATHYSEFNYLWPFKDFSFEQNHLLSYYGITEVFIYLIGAFCILYIYKIFIKK